jgi:hypothetical protein
MMVFRKCLLSMARSPALDGLSGRSQREAT